MKLYHYTTNENLVGIMDNGLIPAGGPTPYIPAIPDHNCIWLDQRLCFTKNPNTAVIRVDVIESLLIPVTYAPRWFRYPTPVPSSNIEIVYANGRLFRREVTPNGNI